MRQSFLNNGNFRHVYIEMPLDCFELSFEAVLRNDNYKKSQRTDDFILTHLFIWYTIYNTNKV